VSGRGKCVCVKLQVHDRASSTPMMLRLIRRSDLVCDLDEDVQESDFRLMVLLHQNKKR
jgi:hypothetical protein